MSTMIPKLSTKHMYAAGACLFGALLWIGTNSYNGGDDAHRRLNLGYHMSKRPERNVWPLKTFDKTKLQFMSSPCRPENDGYFGSTSGTPLEIQYGFELETEDDENVEYLLEEIQEQVVDIVLSTTFPNLCGYRRRQERERHLSIRGLTESRESELKAKPRTTGFRFGMDLDARSDICAPDVDPTNLCGVYKNTIGIYGRHLTEIGDHLLSQVKETLNNEQERLAKDGLVRITTLDTLTVQTGDYGNQPSGIHALSFAAKAAIVVVIIALLAGMATFIAFVCMESKKQKQEHSYMHHHHSKNKKVESANRTVCDEEVSQISETVGLRDGTAVVLEGGRPVVIEFEHGSSGSSSRRQKDAIEEVRSECGSTFFTPSLGPSSPPQYVPQPLLGGDEECKVADMLQIVDGDVRAEGLQPTGTLGLSMDSLSEYTEHTASSDAHELT